MVDSLKGIRGAGLTRRKFLVKGAVAGGTVIGATFIAPSIRTVNVAKAAVIATPLPLPPDQIISGPFSATLNLVQTSPGQIQPLPDNAGFIRTNEVFEGGVVACVGNLCDELNVSCVLVLQNANIFFTGAPDAFGVAPIAGSVDGTFTITAFHPTTGDQIGELVGSYAGGLTGQFNVIPPNALSGNDSATWTVVSGTGLFAGAGGQGTLTAQFQGDLTGETATVVLAGTIV